MTRIKNRFSTGEIITVHDNLLCDLYSLNRDSGFSTVEINRCQYLVNQIQGRGYIIGLRVKIPEDMLKVDGVVKQFEDLDIDVQNKIEDLLADKLYFSNSEIYVANMLFDKFIRFGNTCKASIQELEGYYRKSKKDYSRVKISGNVYNKYMDILQSLIDKEIFLETNNNFRNNKYGARDINLSQKFLSVYCVKNIGLNNTEFYFSFLNFGSIIRQCRRYSTTLDKSAFKVRLNQTMKYVTAFFISRDIFIARGNLLHKPYYVNNELNINMDNYSNLIKYDGRKDNNMGYSLDYKFNAYKGIPNKLKLRKMFTNYILSGLYKSKVYEIEEIYSYDETEDFMEKHEFDYGNDFNLNYQFSINDIGKDVEVLFKVYVDDPANYIY